MKVYLVGFGISLLSLVFGLTSTAQNYVLDGGTNGTVVSTCSGTFTDSGSDSPYQNGENYQITFCSPNADGCLSIFFDEFGLENGWDFLEVYDGADLNANLVGSFTGNESPGLINSSSGCITFRFTSDNSGTSTGWQATISCADCAGFSTASGGSAAGCPNIDVGPDYDVDCEDNCTTLNASVLETGLTTEYTVSAIEYDPPFPFNEGIGFSIGTDDVWSAALNLPFNFCFFGETYDQVTVGSNGLMSFNIAYAGGFCPWAFTATCPSPNLPINSIFGIYHDIDPSVCGDAKYAILGEAPCRVFVLNFDNVCHYSCNNLQSTTQVVLYETTNIIEVYVQDKPTCNNWNSGNALIGIQNTAGNQGYVAPGRQTGPWTASMEAWRFTPSGEPNFEVSWFDSNNELIGTGMSVDVCVPPVGATYFAEVLYTSCDGSLIAENDEINIGIDFETNLQVDPVTCPTTCDAVISIEPLSGSAPYTFDIGDGPQESGVFTDLCPGTYEIIIVDSIGCTAGVIVEVDQPEIPNPGQDATYFVCESDGPFSMTANLGGNPDQNGQWFDSQMNPVSETFDPEVNTEGIYIYVVGVEPCDSSATLEIIITPTVFTDLEVSICEGSLHTLPDGEQVGEAGDYEVILQSEISGCDSVVTTTLVVNPNWTETVEAGICGDNDYVLPDGTTVNQPGEYTVNLFSESGCDSIVVTTLTVVTVDAGEYAPSCTGQFTATLNGSSEPPSADATLTWSGPDEVSFDDVNNPNTVLTAEGGGAYTIELTDSRCPDDPASALVIIREPPQGIFNELPQICFGENPTLQLELTGDYGSPIVWTDELGLYIDEEGSSVTINTANYQDLLPEVFYAIDVFIPGLAPCPPDFASTVIHIVDCDIEIPNIFTPNGDGINDSFAIPGIEFFPGSRMVIFNRWGNKVYESNSYGAPFWNGTNINSGDRVADGVYFYELTLSRLNRIEKGTITVLRNR